MFKLALNAGHGLHTAGKRCMKTIDPNETREWSLNSRICGKIEALLAGYDGIMVRRMDDVTGATDRSITERTNAANSFGADFYLAVHHNAGIGGGTGGGIEAYTYLTVDQTTRDWQLSLYSALIAHTGLRGNRSQPIRTADLGECRQTRMPAVLLECGFMDSTADTPIILTDQFAQSVATACVEVIAARAGLTKKPSAPQPPPEEVKPQPSGIIYRVRKTWEDADSQQGAFTILQNAIANAQKAGMNVYDPTGKPVWEYQPGEPEEPSEPQTPPEEPNEPGEQDSLSPPTLPVEPQKNSWLLRLIQIIIKWFKK